MLRDCRDDHAGTAPAPSPRTAGGGHVPQYVGVGKTSNRMARILAVLQEEPERQWRAREIAELLADVTLVATYRQLARWTKKGLINRIRTGRYAAAEPPTAAILLAPRHQR